MIRLVNTSLLKDSLISFTIYIVFVGWYILVTILNIKIIQLRFTSTLTYNILSIFIWLQRLLTNNSFIIFQYSKISSVFSFSLNLRLWSTHKLVMHIFNLNIIIKKVLICLKLCIMLVRRMVGCNSIDVYMLGFALSRRLKGFMILWILKNVITFIVAFFVWIHLDIWWSCILKY